VVGEGELALSPELFEDPESAPEEPEELEPDEAESELDPSDELELDDDEEGSLLELEDELDFEPERLSVL
jgi:hypothetical protein